MPDEPSPYAPTPDDRAREPWQDLADWLLHLPPDPLADAARAYARRALAAEAECERLLALVNRLADLGDQLLLCAGLELVPGAGLAREWALAREGVGPTPAP
jgi:hypothetical protein